MSGFAWVTLATNDSYSLGALVLAHSLRQVGTAHQLAVLVTPGVSGVMREKLTSVFNVVRDVNVLDSRDEANLRLLQRPDLGITFTKLHCWRLTQFNKCVFLDADTLVLQNADELFEREEFSAAPDVGWPDCFNSGVFVYRPSEDTYEKLIQFALEKGSFDGGDQGLLNLYFSDWAHKDISKHLPFIYNMCSTACYSYLPAFKQFGGNVKIIHFIGNTKPWLQYFDTETRQVNVSPNLHHLQGFVQQWWNIFCSLVHPTLSSEMAGLAGAFARLTLGVPRTTEQIMLEDHLRRQGWEVGNIDYMGRDSFDNIWTKICATLSDGAPASAPPQPAPGPAPAQATDRSPAAPPAQPQQVPEPVKASEIDSAPKEPPAKTAELPIATAQPEPESVSQAEVKSAALPSEASKPEEPCSKPILPTEIKPAVESCPKQAPPPPSDSSKAVSETLSEPKESAVCEKPSTPSNILQPAAAPESPKPEVVASPPTQPPLQPASKSPEFEKPAQSAVAPPASLQTAPAAPSPKAEAAPAPAEAQQTPPPSPKIEAAPAPVQPQQTAPPSPKPEAAPVAAKSQQTPPTSPAPKSKAASTPPSSPAPKAEAAPPKLPQPPKTEAAPAKSQKTPPSSPSPKVEATAAAAPTKSQQTPPSSPLPKSQPKAAAPIKEAAAAPPSEAPSSPAPSAQPKAAPTKKAAPAESSAPEKASAEEGGAAAGGQGPTPPPRKTGGGGSTKKSGKGKK